MTWAPCRALGTLDYHAFLFKGMRRFSNGFSALVSYTFGKTLDLASDNDGGVTLTNIFNPNYDRGLAQYHVKHTLVGSFLYELPFARNHVLGGWQVNGIAYYRTGIPVNITQTGTISSTGNGSGQARPNRAEHRGQPGSRATRRSTSGSIPTAFSGPEPTATYGNIGRNTGVGPSIFNIDLSLVKNTKIGPSTPSSASRPSTCSTTRSSASPTASSATPPSARSRPSATSELRRPAAPPSGRSSSGSSCGSRSATSSS